MLRLRVPCQYSLKIIGDLVNKQISAQCKEKLGYKCSHFQNKPQLFSTYIASKKIKDDKDDSHIGENKKSNVERESDLVPDLRGDPDTFGTLSPVRINRKRYEYDEGDAKEEEYLENKPMRWQQLSTKGYAEIIKRFIRQHKIKEAIDVLEVRMLKEDRVKPENYIYSLLIGACGRVGYTKKAFKLYNDLKSRGLKVHPGMYTGLFNACANSPWIEDGLSRATKLREQILEKGYEPNELNYHAMIKAFGRCGDLQSAFGIADEMVTKRFPLKVDTFNFLLQACKSDSEKGFRHALLVWRKMLTKRITPDIYSFNLMLKITQDCGLGDIETSQNVIAQLTQTDIRVEQITDAQGTANKILRIEPPNLENSTKQIERKTEQTENIQTLSNNESSDNISELNENETSDISTNDSNEVSLVTNEEIANLKSKYTEQLLENKPNLFGKTPHLGNIIALTEIKKPEDRLLLLGGYSGFLEEMERHNVKPDIKTFTVLLQTIPPTIAAEKALMSAIKKAQLKPDVAFFNNLVKKRSMRFDYEGAKDVLNLVRYEDLEPDIITFGMLALGCTTKDEADSLMSTMREHNYRMNAEILGAMLKQACCRRSFGYIFSLMETCQTEEIKPNRRFVQHLEDFQQKCVDLINDRDDWTKTDYFKKGFKKFNFQFTKWLQEVEIDKTPEMHPWEQYRKSSGSGPIFFKDKQTHFKAKHLSRFKVKTSTKVRY